MDLNQRLENVAIVGAAGKMGSGIAALMAQQIAFLKAAPENRERIYRLYLIDVNEAALDGLMQYIRVQLLKAAEKSIVKLRELYADDASLVENKDIIDHFLANLGTFLRPTTDLRAAKDARLVFEAVLEVQELKFSIYKQLGEICGPETLFLTNTSSIPIAVLDREGGLQGRLIGFHFYNPPIVQKLVEVIKSAQTTDELAALAQELGKRLRKTLIPSNDIAGFIGNGHFMRDGLHALEAVQQLQQQGFTRCQAIYIINRVSQDFLVRPMGIFQLLDYVGLDVCLGIFKVMTQYIAGETFASELLDKMAAAKVLGGQRSDGSQKDGFFQYAKGRLAAIYDLEQGQYLPLENGQMPDMDAKIGPLPEGHHPWKALLKDSQRDEKLRQYFKNLAGMDTLGAKLAMAYLRRSREIGEKLVQDGVAATAEDVNGVLTNGFFHLYGPINDYI